MAVEKLSDGIRRFAADAVKLERMLKVDDSEKHYVAGEGEEASLDPSLVDV